ncbi:MAG: hypothetical protein MZV64_19825 [Ignavibacteriales bacterium]|nr:hypothetical protein [Ignavibacteriales bacterium]
MALEQARGHAGSGARRRRLWQRQRLHRRTKTGAEPPRKICTVTLRGYEHDFANPSAGTQEILTLEGTAALDGSFVFENVEMPDEPHLPRGGDRTAASSYQFRVRDRGSRADDPSNCRRWSCTRMTDDTSLLTVDELNIFISARTRTPTRSLRLYTFRNASGEDRLGARWATNRRSLS